MQKFPLNSIIFTKLILGFCISIAVTACGDSRRGGSSGSSIVDKDDCVAEVMSHRDAVVAGCPDAACAEREAKKLMDACAAKKGY